MRLNDAASAVVEGCSWAELTREVKSSLSSEVSSRSRAMEGVPHSISAEPGSQGGWSISLGGGSISWSKNTSECLDGIVSYEFHASYDIRLHEGGQIAEERSSLVLLVELVGQLGLVELGHLKVRDSETALIDGIDDFARLSVTVGFDEGKGSAGSLLEGLSGVDISIVNQLQLSRVDTDSGAKEELSDGDTFNLSSLHENPLVLDVVLRVVSTDRVTYHLNRAVLRVEGEQVVPQQLSLLIEPLGLEDVPVFLHNRHIGVRKSRMRLGHVLRH